MPTEKQKLNIEETGKKEDSSEEEEEEDTEERMGVGETL